MSNNIEKAREVSASIMSCNLEPSQAQLNFLPMIIDLLDSNLAVILIPNMGHWPSKNFTLVSFDNPDIHLPLDRHKLLHRLLSSISASKPKARKKHKSRASSTGGTAETAGCGDKK